MTERSARTAEPRTSSIADVVGRLEGVLRELDHAMAGGRARTTSVPDRRRALGAVDRASALLSVVRSDLLIAERDSDAWRGSGDRSFEAYRGRTTRGGARDALGELRTAETLTSMPTVREAAMKGDISLGHVAVMAKVAAGAGESVRRVMTSGDGQAELVGIAKRLDATQFAKSAAAWVAAHDPGAHERGHQAQRAARYLHLTDTAEGTFIKGRLDLMAGHRLRLALEAASPRPAAQDVRSGEQRRADALVDVAEAVLTAPTTTAGASVRPHVSFHLNAETWAALRSMHAADGSESGAHGAGYAPVAPVTVDDGMPVPFSEVARVLCDCELTRIVVGADSELLDVGRAARTYTGALRRAVIARDRHCGWPGCSQQARWCEVHHIRWWDRDDGPTSADNGVLLCSFHHHEVHRNGYTLIRRPGAPPGPGGDGTSWPPGRSGEDDRPRVALTLEAPGASASAHAVLGATRGVSGATQDVSQGVVARVARGVVARVHYTVHARDGHQVAPVDR